jgi:GTP pyrophosphokinase/guanosine-3',5'-bis(diphosphate) 3'-pyrophosphohydrolase
MEDVANRGVAAHWAYKDENYAYDPDRAQASGGDPLKRIRPLIEMMEQSGDADEFLDNVKLEMFTDQVFTFTPKGDLIALPRGASPIDFAYAVHTKVGDTCIGALVNGRDVPLRTQLENGDVVKIVRGGTAEPQPGWESIATTGRARQALRRLTREGEMEEFRRIGETLALHAFKREGQDLDSAVLSDALKRLKMSDETSLFETLGRGHLSMTDFVEAVFPGRSESQIDGGVYDLDLIDDESAALYVKGDGVNPGIGLHLAECCSPIPGDRILGLQIKGGGIAIHTIDCDELAADEEQSANWIDLAWRRAAKQAASTARVVITVEHVPGALADVTKIIGESKGNLTNIKTMRRSPTFFDMIIDVDVRDTRHLMSIIAALRASAFVVKVDRSRALPSFLKA